MGKENKDPEGTKAPPTGSDADYMAQGIKKVAEIIGAPEGFEDKKKDPTKK